MDNRRSHKRTEANLGEGSRQGLPQQMISEGVLDAMKENLARNNWRLTRLFKQALIKNCIFEILRVNISTQWFCLFDDLRKFSDFQPVGNIKMEFWILR